MGNKGKVGAGQGEHTTTWSGFEEHKLGVFWGKAVECRSTLAFHGSGNIVFQIHMWAALLQDPPACYIAHVPKEDKLFRAPTRS